MQVVVMRLTPCHSPLRSALVRARRLRGFRRNEKGAAAVEFAGVVIPFLMFILGIMGAGLQFFAMNALEHGVETASRAVRTGQAQTGTAPETVAQFKTAVCNAAGPFLKCDDAHMHIIVNSWASWSSVTTQQCYNSTSKTFAASTGTGTDLVSKYSGGAGQVVLITVCYKWDMTKGLQMLAAAGNKMDDGSIVLQASTAFRTECYDTSC